MQSKKRQGPCCPVAASLVGIFHNYLSYCFICKSCFAITYNIFDKKNLCLNSGSFSQESFLKVEFLGHFQDFISCQGFFF